MDLGLQGKVALVAAASKGLGYGIAHALAAEGAKVSICSRDEGAITAAAQRLHDETGAETLATACDVRDAAAIQAWIERTVQTWGNIDALAINAGGPPAGPLKTETDERWQAAFELTLMSTVRMIRGSLPYFNRGGAILAVTSSSVRQPIPNLGVSTAMRLAVAGVLKTFSRELADDGIRVNNLVPGRIDTDRVRELDEGVAAREGISFEAVRERSVQNIPFKRLGTIEEFGAAGAFLLSPAASYITGATLVVDGGGMSAL
ncbi:MAG: SDR family oxidoreductase [Chloroflexi bacterium]|nr:MAG: SDR family oxidoreductase [Chloroflexota bacterium]